MLRIHQHLIDEKYPNCSKLGKSLEVSSKTIQRDLDYMRDQLNLPIDYENSRHGYYYTEPVTHFPTIPTTEGELLALFVAQKALQQYRGTSFEKPLANAFEKLAQVMEDEVTVSLQELTDSLSFHHTGAAVMDMEVFQAVHTALREYRVLTFNYKKLKGKRKEARKVEPYHLGSIDGQWYLFAHDLDRDDMRTFVLGRIQETPRIGRKFKKDKDFSLRERLMGSFGVFSGEGRYRVQIEFDDFASQLVRERNWHPTQEIEDLPGSELRLTLQLDSLEEIERWILGWGGHARVVRPQALQRRVRAALKEMQDNYYGSSQWLADFTEQAQASQPDRILQLALESDLRLDAPGQMRLRMDQPVN